jgi:hypothetical protein
LSQCTWEDLNGLESSEGCRSAGGHGNQHVRLRSAQVSACRSDLRGSVGDVRIEP